VPPRDQLVEALVEALGDASLVRTEPLELSLYDRDGSLYQDGHAPVACFPLDTSGVAAVVSICAELGQPFVARGSGTGLSGGAVPVGEPLVIVLTKMDEVLEVDLEDRVAWVQPGVLNLDLSRSLEPHGLHFAPDPSSQQVCSIGGNVANNSGGPHCLAYGVTSAHVLAIEVVLPDGSVELLGGLDSDPPGYDLRGVFVGSEGTLGIATRVAVRLTSNPPAVKTILIDFMSTTAGAHAVSAIIAEGLVPAALEMMDGPAVEMIEQFVHAGYPTDAAAVLLVEVDGLHAGVEAATETVRRVCMAGGARSVRVAESEAERQLLWKGRKAAFGAIARIEPDYYLHDTVVPRARLVEVLESVYEIAARHDLKVVNVFHAGDGNLHPILAFDSRQQGVTERVRAASTEIVEVSLAAGGVLSGEHGIGIEKRDFMPLLFAPVDLEAQDRLRGCFDPRGLANPAKVIPSGSRCGDFAQAVPDGAWV
jgi:glycolate oxidase